MGNTNSIEQGNNSVTRREGDWIVKSRPEGKANLFEHSYETQAKLWNQYYKDTPYAGAYVSEAGEFFAPFIEGIYPTNLQKLQKAQEILDKGCPMLDCRDNRNFIYRDGVVYPVDFGQIHTLETTPRFYETYKGMVRAYIKKEDASAPKISHSQALCLRDVEKKLKELEQHAKTKLDVSAPDSAEIKKNIIEFVSDTRVRIEKYRQGDSQAFCNFQKDNSERIQSIGKDKVAGAMWKSILVTLATGIIPALLIGGVQYLATKGNSFLFFSNRPQAQRKAQEICDTLLEPNSNSLGLRQRRH